MHQLFSGSTFEGMNDSSKITVPHVGAYFTEPCGGIINSIGTLRNFKMVFIFRLQLLRGFKSLKMIYFPFEINLMT